MGKKLDCKVYIIKSPGTLPEGDDTTVFLAGGITDCPDWQDDLTEMLRSRDDELDKPVLLLNPRRDDFDVGDATMELQQITWEFDALSRADMIVFWFNNETLCPIVLYELGMWGNSRNTPIVLGIDPKYKRKHDVLIQTALAKGRKMTAVSSVRALSTRLIKGVNQFKTAVPRTCVNCKFFEHSTYPIYKWERRVEKLALQYPDLPERLVRVLADNRDICEKDLSDTWGKCKFKDVPELRDVELDGRNFGCIHFK